MNAITIGPLMLAADRFAALIGILVFMIVSGFMARRWGSDLERWSLWTLLGGIVLSRLNHAVLHISSFTDSPLRIFAFWQGGFHWSGAVVAGAIALVLTLQSRRERLLSFVPLAAGVLVWNIATQLTADNLHTPLPEIRLPTLAGELHQLSDGEEPMVINLWASWCPPCRREMPLLASAAAQATDIDFIFANQGEASDVIRRYLQRDGLQLETVLLDQFSQLSQAYGAPGLPATLFIGRDGTLNHAQLGEISPEALTTHIRKLRQSSTVQETR